MIADHLGLLEDESLDGYAPELIAHAEKGDGPVPHETVMQALTIIDRSNVMAQMALFAKQDRAGRHAGGRPPALSDRAVLAILLTSSLHGAPLLVNNMANIVAERLAPESLDALGIEHDGAGGEQWYFRIWRAIDRFMAPLDYHSGLSRHRRLTPEAFGEWESGRDLDDSKVRHDRMLLVTNLLLHGTYLLLPRSLRRKWKGNTSIDGTFVASAARQKKYAAGNRLTIEPFSAPYVKDDGYKGRGWEAYLVVAAKNDPLVEKDFPHLVLGLAFDRQNTDAKSTVDSYSVMSYIGYPAGEAAGDRAFFKAKNADECQIPMLRLGHCFVRDYQVGQLGIQDHFAGANMVDGQWYCPEMPEALVSAERDRREQRIDDQTYQLRIAARTRWAATRKARPDAQGATRWSHPVGADGKPVCNHERKGAPRFCVQKTVLFPIEAGAKYVQEYPLGSPEHAARYAFPRNTVESANAKAKSDRHGLERTKRRRVRGQPRHHLFAAVILAAVNVATIINFYKVEAGLVVPKRSYKKPSVYGMYSWSAEALDVDRVEKVLIRKPLKPDPAE